MSAPSGLLPGPCAHCTPADCSSTVPSKPTHPGLVSSPAHRCLVFWLLGHTSQLGRCCARVSQIRSTGPLTVRKPYASRPKQSCVLTLQDLAFGSGMCCRTIILSTVSPTATDLLHSTNSLLQVTQMRGTQMYNLFQFEP